MIAPVSRKETSAWHTQFLAMLQPIQDRARFAFQDLNPDVQEEAIQAVVAQALVDFLRLVEQDRGAPCISKPPGRYADTQVRGGRCIERG